MEIKVVYIADDGTKFTDKDECEAYEYNHIVAASHIHAYNADFEPIDWEDMNAIHYLKFDNYAALNWFNDRCEQYGYASVLYESPMPNDTELPLPEEDALWYWSNTTMNYERLAPYIREKIVEYEHMLHFFETLKG